MVMPPGSVQHSAISEEKASQSTSPSTTASSASTSATGSVTSYTNLSHKDMVDGKGPPPLPSSSTSAMGSSSLKPQQQDLTLLRSRSDNTADANSSSAVDHPSLLSYSRFNESDLPASDLPSHHHIP